MKKILACFLSFLLLLLSLVSCSGGGESAPAPYLPAECVGMDYKELEDAFRSSGFVNISLVPQDTSISSSADKVIGIEIDIPGAGTYKDYNSANKFSLDSEIIITYNRYTNPAGSEPPENTPAESDPPASTGNVLLDSELIVGDVMNGTGTEVIGQYAYIRISADQLKEITSDSLVEFAKTRVENSGYNWVSIVSDNRNGIIFTNSDIIYPIYGKLSEKDKALEEDIGFLSLSDGVYTYSES